LDNYKSVSFDVARKHVHVKFVAELFGGVPTFLVDFDHSDHSDDHFPKLFKLLKAPLSSHFDIHRGKFCTEADTFPNGKLVTLSESELNRIVLCCK
jgi:hypothetical protein